MQRDSITIFKNALKKMSEQEQRIKIHISKELREFEQKVNIDIETKEKNIYQKIGTVE